jgi:dihydropyrimidinase
VAEGQGSFIETPVYPPFVYDAINGVKKDDGDDLEGLNGLHQIDLNQPEFDRKTPEPYHHPDPKYVPGPAYSISGESQMSITPSARGHRPNDQRDLQGSTFSISGKFILNFTFLRKVLY